MTWEQYQLLLHNVQLFSYNKVWVATSNTISQNYNKDKAQNVFPPALLHFVQPLFQPCRNRRPTTCQSCHKCAKSAQNPLVTLQPQPVTWLIRLMHHQTQNIIAPMLDSSLLQLCFLYIWVGVEPKCHVCSLSGPVGHVISTPHVFDLIDDFPYSSTKCSMWSALVWLWSVSCSTLHSLLHLSACFYTTCPTVSKVPTLAIHVRPVTPNTSASWAHIVQVCPKSLFGATTPYHLWDHFGIYSWYSNNRSNSFISVHPWPLPKENVPDTEVAKCFQVDSTIFKWHYAVGSLHAHHPWPLLRSMQPIDGGAQLVLTPSPLH